MQSRTGGNKPQNTHTHKSIL